MSVTDWTSKGPSKSTRIIGWAAAVCFLLQQFVLPVHLAIHEHCLAVEHAEGIQKVVQGEHAGHHHHGAGQAHEHGETSGDHEPHPVDDHPQGHEEPEALPVLVQGPIALPEAWSHELTFDLPFRRDHVVRAQAARPPPARDAASPRAPPVVS